MAHVAPRGSGVFVHQVASPRLANDGPTRECLAEAKAGTTLERIDAYFRQCESSHPAPISPA